MARYQVSTVIHQPTEVVWPLLSDPAKVPQWDTGIREVRQTSPGPAGVGTTLVAARARRGGGTTLLDVRITTYEPPLQIAWALGRGGFEFGWIRHVLEPIAEGTRYTKTVELRLPGWMTLLVPIVVRRQRREDQRDVANVKRVAETGA